MRNLILAFIGFLFLTAVTGCGALKTIAADTCTGGNYNHIVCPGLLEEALDAPPAKATPTKSASTATPKECRASGYMIRRRVLTRSKGACTNQRLLLQEHIRKVGPGVKCRFTRGQILCAGITADQPLKVLFFICFLFLFRSLSDREARLVILIGLVALAAIVGMVETSHAACTDAELQVNRVSAQYGMVLYNCRTKEIQQLDVKATKDFLKTTCEIQGEKLVCAGFDHPVGILLILLTLLWGRGLCDFLVANVENEGSYHNRYLEKDYICPFGRMQAACRIMIIALVAVILLLATTTNLYAACTEKQTAVNKVTTQYGFFRYDCDEDEVSQASKDAIFEVVWRGFVAKGGLKMGMSKPYVYTRWQRLESVFFKVWGDAPLWKAKVAVAICTKEYVCGVSTKFSEWEGKRWESRKNDNGSVDCGITQINSDSTDKSCDELQDYETAFREQRRILMEKIKSEKKSVWKKRIFRYNGSGKSAREYGEKIWDWSGASFGWVALLMGFLGRRRKGHVVGPIAHGHHCPEANLLAWHQATPEGTRIPISDLDVVPQCIRDNKPLTLTLPILAIEEDHIIVMEGCERDVISPVIMRQYTIEMERADDDGRYAGERLETEITEWSNGDRFAKKQEKKKPGVQIESARLRINQTISLGGREVHGCVVMVVTYVYEEDGRHQLTDYKAVTPNNQEWATWTKDECPWSQLHPWTRRS